MHASGASVGWTNQRTADRPQRICIHCKRTCPGCCPGRWCVGTTEVAIKQERERTTLNDGLDEMGARKRKRKRIEVKVKYSS